MTSCGAVACRLVNLSAGGVGVLLLSSIRLALNERVSLALRSGETFVCRVRWSAHPRYGAEFASPSEFTPRLQALYDELESKAP